MPLALGIHFKHDASVAICSPEGIICSIAEERISRIKHHFGFPQGALDTAFRQCGISAKDISLVAFSTRKVAYPRHLNAFQVGIEGICRVPPELEWRRRFYNWAKNKIRIENQKRDMKNADEFSDRHWSHYEEYLSDLGLMDKRISYYYIAHHRAHASSAFRLSGLAEACVLTLDGLGEKISGTIYKGYPDGRMELLRSSSAKNSLGSFYQAITEALGFIPVDSEYKTMGLAALGSSNGAENPFHNIVEVRDGVLKSSIPWQLRDYNLHHPEKKVPNPLSSIKEADDFKLLLEKMPREEFAYFAQEHCEENMLSYAQDAMRITGLRSIAAAGGVMLNVKGNEKIMYELKPSDYFVFPDSGDSGLAVGAAMEALYQSGALKKQTIFYNPFLGHEFSDEEIKQEISSFASAHNLLVRESDPEFMAEILAQGKVVGAFQGRLEMGPRSLGNRSVLADPRSTKIKDRINSILKGREYFVPFAPAILEEDAHFYWDESNSKDYRYMTFTVKANDFAKKTIPAVIHFDGSMRPEVVSQDFNPWLYNVLREFKKRTGVGVLLNTSFNRHGLPIVGSPKDALEHLINGWVDGLSIGKYYIEKK